MSDHGPCWAILAALTALIGVSAGNGYLLRIAVKATVTALAEELRKQGVVGCSYKGKE